jgi:hypothetical protein
MLGATEIRNETSDINMTRSFLQIRASNVSYRSDTSFEKRNITHWADITLLYMCIVNETQQAYRTVPSTCIIVHVTSLQVPSSVPVKCYTFDLSLLS